MGTVLAQLGHGACPSWVTCLPLLGRFAVRRLPNKWLLWHPYFHITGFCQRKRFLSSEFLSFDNSFHLTITFISKLSRQLPDNRKTVNYLFVRTLRWKTRWSDSFLEILCHTVNQRYFFHSFVMSSRVLPLVSGTSFQTNSAASTQMTPYIT